MYLCPPILSLFVAMKKLSEFDIVYTGLNLGHHRFEYQLDRTFFEHFEYLEINEGQFDVIVELEKQETLLTLQFDLQGQVKLACDRCGSPLSLKVNFNDVIYFKFGEGESTDESVILISPTDYRINISTLLAEFAQLSLPFRRVHLADQCDKEALKTLEDLKKVDKNDVDPCWDALLKLKKE